MQIDNETLFRVIGESAVNFSLEDKAEFIEHLASYLAGNGKDEDCIELLKLALKISKKLSSL